MLRLRFLIWSILSEALSFTSNTTPFFLQVTRSELIKQTETTMTYKLIVFLDFPALSYGLGDQILTRHFTVNRHIFNLHSRLSLSVSTHISPTKKKRKTEERCVTNFKLKITAVYVNRRRKKPALAVAMQKENFNGSAALPVVHNVSWNIWKRYTKLEDATLFDGNRMKMLLINNAHALKISNVSQLQACFIGRSSYSSKISNLQ